MLTVYAWVKASVFIIGFLALWGFCGYVESLP